MTRIDPESSREGAYALMDAARKHPQTRIAAAMTDAAAALLRLAHELHDAPTVPFPAGSTARYDDEVVTIVRIPEEYLNAREIRRAGANYTIMVEASRLFPA